MTNIEIEFAIINIDIVMYIERVRSKLRQFEMLSNNDFFDIMRYYIEKND